MFLIDDCYYRHERNSCLTMHIKCDKETMTRRSADVKTGVFDVHCLSLAFGLSLSLVERMSNKQVIHFWAPFPDLHKKLTKVMKCAFDQKNKRCNHYENIFNSIQFL